MSIIKRLLNSIVFWGTWIIIPVLMEIVPAFCSLFLLRRRKKKIHSYERPLIYPEITLIIPVYNSEDTLSACIESIHRCTYPNERIQIFLVNNQGQDDSFSVFDECQEKFPELKMQWMNAEQGKSRALNLALFNSEGKYIINVDSDGVLEPLALTNMISKFEADPELNCMTGVILTRADQISSYKGFHRLLRNLEFMEYAQAFLAGRSYASEMNMMFTLSGAFSAFRKSAILKSWLYNTDTVGEDTHITFQMRYRMKERVEICENAIFFVDPIESINKLYTQRQRWQRGSLEVAHMFMDKNFRLTRAFKDINVNTQLYDHTFAFPRMLWYFALLCLLGMNYSVSTVLASTGIIFGLYILVGFFYFFTAARILKMDEELHRYYVRHWWCVPLLPLFNIVTFFIRITGIINSIYSGSSWKARDLTEESHAFVQVLREDLTVPGKVWKRIKGLVNRKPKAARGNTGEKSPYSPVWYVCVGLLLFVGVLLFVAVSWSKKTFGVEFNEILNTLLGPVEGTGEGMVSTIVKGLVLPVAGVLVLYVLVTAIDVVIGRKLRKGGFWKKRRGKLYRACHAIAALLVTVTLFGGVLYANAEYEILDYYAESGSKTTIYEDYYVSPRDVSIRAEGKTKNLIYIYVESLENTYAATEDGGFQKINYIPKLTALANENLNFSDKGKMGGFHILNGTNWTMAALFSTTSGIPYAMPVEDNVVAEADEYMPGVVNLGDILEENGYVQEFICGSDGSFAGRKKYFEQHGNYNVFDVYSAREAGYVDKDYWHNWGIEDKVLFDIARDEITDLAAEGKPFNFTLLTVDLHATDGYLCEWCGDDYEGITANVAACSDRLVAEFVEWCGTQEFYDDSVIVITGDHPRMDTSLVENVPRYERTVYNCFINADRSCELDNKSRVFTSPDIFPTVLSALGFQIEGDRLGLGVNLFSSEKTLVEEKGFDWVYQEVSKSSDYYVSTFAPNIK